MKAHQYHTDEEEDNQLDEVSHAQTFPQIPGAISDIPTNQQVNNYVWDTEHQVVHDTPMHTKVVESDDDISWSEVIKWEHRNS